MDVRFSDEQIALRDGARAFLERECPMDEVRRFAEDPIHRPDELWRKMSELGWMGLVVPETYGGAGLDWVDLALVLEEMGRVLLPAPYLASVVAGALIARAGSDAQRRRWLPDLASGRRIATIAQLEDSQDWSADGIALAWSPERPTLSGVKRFVPDGCDADLLVVAARTGEGITLVVVERNAGGLAPRPIAYWDATRRLGEIHFDDTPAPPEAVLGEVGAGWPHLEWALDAARVALCAELCGAAGRALDLSVAYAKTREQFGTAIGSFQAIQHKCADMLVQVEAARSATWYAAWALAQDEPDAHVSTCLAKAFCSDACTRVAGEGIQIHGGLGYTWEQDLHLYYKRAKASELLYGDGDWNRELAARALLD